MGDSQLIIQASAVIKTYDTGKLQVNALQGVDLNVARGEVLAIMGPSGCGKTTLLNCLSGLDVVDSGQVLIEGADINALSDNKRTEYRAHHMGFIFQFYNLLPVLSAIENVELPLLVSGIGSKEARQRASAALERVNLTSWSTHKPSELSGGQRQRVTIARALVNDPAIVWADEPTGDLDSSSAEQIMDILCDLNERQGQTLVIVTHDQDVADRTHRIVRMMDGAIVDDQITGHS